MASVAPFPTDYAFPDVEGGGVPEDYVPEGFEDQDEFLKDMREQYRLDAEYDRENREAAFDDKVFWSGDIWDPLVKQYRQNLPCVTINDLPQKTGQLTGDWRVNKAAIKVLPAEDGDEDIASIRSDLIRNIEVQSRSERATNNAFESMIICGDGAFRVDLDYAYEDVFDQDIRINPIEDALAVVWDRLSIDPTGRDASRCFVDDMMERGAFEERWPDQSPSDLRQDYAGELRTGGWLSSDQGCGLVRVTEYWRMIERPQLVAMFQDGSVRDITDMNEMELVRQWGPPVRLRNSLCRYAQMHLVTGHAILEGPYEYKLTRLPIIRMTGRTISLDGRRVRFGLVRPMKDLIRLKCFWRSKEAEYLGYATKAKWKAFANAVAGREQIWRNSHLSDDTLLIANDGTTMPEEVTPPQLPAALLQAAAGNSQDMKDVSGLHDASLGIRSNETSGVAIQARQREGDIASVVYYDHGNAALMECGDVVNQFIDQTYDSARTLRVLGEDGTARLQRINDPMDPKSVDLSKGRYDVTITTGASYTTKRVEAAQAMESFFQGDPAMKQAYADLYFKMLDVPYNDQFAERAKKLLPPELADEEDENRIPPQVHAQMQEMMAAIEAMQAENEALKTDRSLDERKLDIDAYAKKTDRLKALTSIPLGPEGIAEAQGIIDESDELTAPEAMHQMPDGSMMAGPPMEAGAEGNGGAYPLAAPPNPLELTPDMMVGA